MRGRRKRAKILLLVAFSSLLFFVAMKEGCLVNSRFCSEEAEKKIADHERDIFENTGDYVSKGSLILCCITNNILYALIHIYCMSYIVYLYE